MSEDTTPDRTGADQPAPDQPAPDEPTQPLSGWQAPAPAPAQQSGPSPIPRPQHPGWGLPPGQQPSYAEAAPTRPMVPSLHATWPAPAPERERRRLTGMSWIAISCLALVLGLVGGLAGAALEDHFDESAGGPVPEGLGGVSTQTAAPLEADNGSVAAVAQSLLPSTVQILAEHEGRPGGATGSGFVLDREGHIVTNNHVVASAAEDDGTITVIDHRGKRHEASVVGRSPVYDLAVLSVERADALEPAALGASRGLRVGDPVVAFGAPLGLSQTVTSGIVSALDRPVTTGDSANDSSYINAVQTDAAINPGNSGGPLVNLSGQVVGVNSAIATTGSGFGGESGNIGVGFAIPIEQVRVTVDQILRTGEAQYPVIGAKVSINGDDTDPGALITEVMPDTPASRAGLKKDDTVLAVGEKPVTDGIALIVAIRTYRPGDTVEFTIRRGEREQTVSLTLDGEVG